MLQARISFTNHKPVNKASNSDALLVALNANLNVQFRLCPSRLIKINTSLTPVSPDDPYTNTFHISFSGSTSRMGTSESFAMKLANSL